jgi:hypothetical protein
MSLVDPTGYLLTTIRDAAGVAALTARVRVDEPMGRTVNSASVETDAGDARGPGKWVRFIVISRLARSREKRLPIQEARYVARCYGQGGNPWQDADALAGAVSDAIHNTGPMRNAAGVVLFQLFDDGGEGPTADPMTHQPHSDVIVSVIAGTQVAPIA